jgi:hypothetical protein
MSRQVVNADKPHRWKKDIAASVDYFNQWFVVFAPETFRMTRVVTTEHVIRALHVTDDLRRLDVTTLRSHPGILPTLRMCTAPPLAVDRLVGLTGVSRNLIERLEQDELPDRIVSTDLDRALTKICDILSQLLDRDIFPWLVSGTTPNDQERDRSATIIADRRCSSVANPIIRNAQEQRQLTLIGKYLEQLGYRKQPHPLEKPITEMEAGTFTFHLKVLVGTIHKVNIPIDVVIQPVQPRQDRLPVLIEAKSAGDFTNTNKRRKEEAMKVRQLRETFGQNVTFVLFLCGYFGSDYLGYVAAEGINWVWEHRIDELKHLGL